jgi:hypothetical protein
MEKSLTIGEMKTFLNRLGGEYDNHELFNGEFSVIEGEYYARVDNPVLYLEIDKENSSLLLLHQTKDDIKTILKELNGNTKATE